MSKTAQQEEYKGMHSFTPEEYERLEYLTGKWIQTVKRYGFKQCKTPLLDPLAIYEDKTSEEIVTNQTYTFTDRGNTKVTIRPELTPGVARMFSKLKKSKAIRKPYKLFTIGSVFRYEKQQHGRTREHIQFNADIFDAEEKWSDIEIITLAIETLKNIGIPIQQITIQINDRNHLTERLKKVGAVREKDITTIVRLLDKKNKISNKALNSSLQKINNALTLNYITDMLQKEPETVRTIRTEIKKRIKNVHIQYTPSLVRGFDYYTNMVFEIYTPSIKRSLVGGGRYNNLVEKLYGNSASAVGFGMGDVTALLATKKIKTVSPKTSHTPSVTFFVNDENDVLFGQQIAQELRNNNITVSFAGTTPKKLDKWYTYAKEKLGNDALLHLVDNDTILVKNLNTRRKKEISIAKKNYKKLVSHVNSL